MDEPRSLISRITSSGVGLPLLALAVILWTASILFGGKVTGETCTMLCSYDYSGPKKLLMWSAVAAAAAAVIGGIRDLVTRRWIAGTAAVIGGAGATWVLGLLAFLNT